MNGRPVRFQRQPPSVDDFLTRSSGRSSSRLAWSRLIALDLAKSNVHIAIMSHRLTCDADGRCAFKGWTGTFRLSVDDDLMVFRARRRMIKGSGGETLVKHE